jgi:hypothetical protein
LLKWEIVVCAVVSGMSATGGLCRKSGATYL